MPNKTHKYLLNHSAYLVRKVSGMPSRFMDVLGSILRRYAITSLLRYFQVTYRHTKIVSLEKYFIIRGKDGVKVIVKRVGYLKRVKASEY